MAIRIRDSVIKTWSSQTQRQFGIDRPLRLDINSSAEETFLAMVELGIADGQLETAAKLAGLPLDLAKNLLSKLSAITEDFTPPLARSELSNLPSPQRANFHNRQQAVVFIPNLDRLGKLLVHALAHAGIGKIVVGDSSLISDSDCGRLGYQRAQIGASKLSVIKSEVANAPSLIKLDNRMSWADYAGVDIAVVSSSGAFQPTDYQRWLSLSKKHIGICFSDKHVLVTSIVEEGLACLGCRELNRWQVDAGRKLVCNQIAGVKGLKNSLAIMFSASITAQRIINEIDGGKEISDIEFWRDGKIESVAEQINPDCGCQQAPGEI